MSDYRDYVGRQVLVQLVAGNTISGTLTRLGKDVMVLEHAEFIGNGTRKPIDGEVVVERSALSWVQVP